MMMRRVPYLHERSIEQAASSLLSDYNRSRDIADGWPVPIEDIVEKHLKLSLEFDDMHRLFDVPRPDPRNPDILGAIYFESRRIVIDESLDPEEYPAMEGRYRFTLAHEAGGHCCLHRDLSVGDPAQTSLFDPAMVPSVVCRSTQAKERIEWQADFFASCLLMPRNLVFAAWLDMFPDGKQRVLQPRSPISHDLVEVPRFECRIPGVEFVEPENNALNRFAEPLAALFLVSPIAMRIRLEQLGLLLRVVPDQGVLRGSA